MFFGIPFYIPPYMDRHTIVIAIIIPVLSAGLLLFPVNAEVDAGPDTSGYDLDIGRIATGLLADDLSVVMSPPRYQWDAERWMDEGDKCAAQYKEYHTRFIDRGYIVYQQMASKQGYTPLDKNTFSTAIFTDSDGVIIGSILLEAKDPQAVQYYNSMNAYGACIEKNYNTAMSKIQKDDFLGNAAAWDRVSGMYQMLGNDKRAQESHEKATEYREAADTKSLIDALFGPLPEWLAVLGVIGGLFLFYRRNT